MRRLGFLLVVPLCAALAAPAPAAAEASPDSRPAGPWEGTWDTTFSYANGSQGDRVLLVINADASATFNGGDTTSFRSGVNGDNAFGGEFVRSSGSPRHAFVFAKIVGTELGTPVFQGTWDGGVAEFPGGPDNSGSWRGKCIAGPCNGAPSSGSSTSSTGASCSASGTTSTRKHKKHRRRKKKHKRRARGAQADVCQDLWSAPRWNVDDPRFDGLSLTYDGATKQLTGTYAGGGKLIGDVTKGGLGGVATGTFSDSTGTGTFVFKLTDTERFEGSITPDSGGTTTITGTKPET